MAPPNPIAIATSSVQRLVKEETSYHHELEKQHAHLKQAEATDDGDENREFTLNQERRAIEETKKIFPPLRERIYDAVQKLEDTLQIGQEKGSVTDEEVAKAKEVIQNANELLSKPVTVST